MKNFREKSPANEICMGESENQIEYFDARLGPPPGIWNMVFGFLAFLFARNKSIFYAKESQFVENPPPKFFCRLNASNFDRANEKKLIHFSSESAYKFSIFYTLKCKIFSLQLIPPPKIIFDIKLGNIQRALNKCPTALSADRCNAMHRICIDFCIPFHL